MRRFGDAESVVAAVLYLVSDETSYVTGSTFFVDGGWRAGGRAAAHVKYAFVVTMAMRESHSSDPDFLGRLTPHSPRIWVARFLPKTANPQNLRREQAVRRTAQLLAPVVAHAEYVGGEDLAGLLVPRRLEPSSSPNFISGNAHVSRYCAVRLLARVLPLDGPIRKT
jgi:hypothetical protein